MKTKLINTGLKIKTGETVFIQQTFVKVLFIWIKVNEKNIVL